MLKTDAMLQKNVIDELRWEPAVGPAEIGVAARDGVVTLAGQVDTHARRWAAVRCAERVPGVRAIADEIEVVLPLSAERTDTDLAHEVADALRWDVEVPDERVRARIERGWVWLEGEVEREQDARAAERTVRSLPSVRGVTNLIDVVPAPSPAAPASGGR